MITTPSLHPLAAEYLDRLERAARRLPRGERHELVDEISTHLSEATDPSMSDAAVLSVLDRLGDPESIVQAQQPEPLPRRRAPSGLEWTTILLLLLGGFIFFVGWIAGAILLWGSRAWSVRDKVIGTLVVPGGLATAPVVGLLLGTARTCTRFAEGPEHCTPGPSTVHNILSAVVIAFCVLGPICTSVYLARRVR
jgi:HAAS